MAEFPGKERSERFKPEETKLLVELVRSKQNAIYGDSKTGPKPNDAKQAWEEIAACISSSSGVVRSAFQCRKRYNDVRRRGKDKAATFRREMAGTGGGPSTVEPLTPAEELAVSTLPSESIEGFAPSSSKNASPPGPSTLPDTAPIDHRSNARPRDQPFLDLQKRGFDRVEKELRGLRRNVANLMAPLNSIAASLARLSEARSPAPTASPHADVSLSDQPAAPAERLSEPQGRRGSSRGRPRLRRRGGRKL
ncbi:hypothetical protein WMY93_033698 [Mugilogobius chulae]|uniref:Myb-like domain-containing protein n=1 Tax=Mugilogobius chulae TaxID=88201 RepID=A0AAW0MGK8_9GOBI